MPTVDINRAPGPAKTDRPPAIRTRLAVAAFVGLVVVATLYAASGGVRGSDQYWYVADVETLVRDRAIATNVVFPVGLLGDGSGLPPPFIHNSLSVYLAAIPALLVGPYGGWVALNLLVTLGAAFLIYRTARLVANRWAAMACAVLYPLLPLTLWHTAQPLAEASISFFAALAVYSFATSGSSTRRWLGLVAALGLLYASRQSYLPLLLAAPLAFLVIRIRTQRRSLRGAISPAGLILGATLLVVAVVNGLFAAENVEFSYTRLWHTAVPNRTDNMWFNFDLSDANLSKTLPFDLDLLGPKLAGHLAQQFVMFESAPLGVFYWTFNVLAIVAIAKLLREREARRVKLLAMGTGFVALHFVTVVLFQNQFRYSLPALPILLVILAMALSDVRWLDRRMSPRPIALALVVCVLGLAPSVVLARTLRAEGVANGQQQAAVQALFDRRLASTEPLWIVFEGTPQLLAYAARPRLALHVAPSYSIYEYRRLLAAFPSRWILAPSDSRALDVLELRGDAPVDGVDVMGRRWELHDLAGSNLGASAKTVP